MSKNNIIRISFILGAIIILLLSSYNINIVATRMSDENLYANQKAGVVFIQINPSGASEEAGIKVGDRLVMINEDSIKSANHAQSYLDRAKPGESLIYTIEREGKIFDVRVNLALLGLRIAHVATIITGLIFLFFGLFIVQLKPDKKYLRLLSLMTFSLSFLLLNQQVYPAFAINSPTYFFVLIVFVINVFLMFPLTYHVMLFYPDRKYEEINRFWMIKVNYILAGICCIASIIAIIIVNNFNPSAMLIPLGYIIFLNIKYRKKRLTEYKKRSRLIFYATIISVAVIVILVIFTQQYFYIEYIAFVFCIFPLAYFYTTIKYRVYDIYIKIRLSLVYSVFQVVILILFIISIFLLSRFLPLWKLDLPAIILTGSSFEIRNLNQLSPELQVQIQQGYLVFIGIILAFVLFLVKNRIQILLDKVFFQQKYDYRKALKNFVEILSSYLTRETIGEKSVEQINDIMKIKGATLAISDNGHYQVTKSVGALTNVLPPQFILPENSIREMISNKKQIRQNHLSELGIFKTEPSSVFCGVLIVSGNDKLEAILFTGEKQSESAYNNDDFELLSFFADHLGTVFERARLYEEMADKERLKRELEIAREIQLNSLPKCEPNYKGLEICASLAAAYEVGGDYYDYLEHDSENLGIIVGDVVGKGTSAAFHMSKIQGFLQAMRQEALKPEDMLIRLNSLIKQNFNPEFFFTALYGIFNTDNKTLKIFRLGHNGLIYYNAQHKKIEIIEPKGIGFGMTDQNKFEKNLGYEIISYSKSDVFVFLTDGFMEAMNAELKPFGEEKICQIIQSEAQNSASNIMDALLKAIKNFGKTIQHDDATGVVVKINI